MNEETAAPELLVDVSEHWYRQAQPDAVVDRDQVTYLAFRLTSRDKGKLSGARCRKQTARGAYDEHIARAAAVAARGRSRCRKLQRLAPQMA